MKNFFDSLKGVVALLSCAFILSCTFLQCDLKKYVEIENGDLIVDLDSIVNHYSGKIICGFDHRCEQLGIDPDSMQIDFDPNYIPDVNIEDPEDGSTPYVPPDELVRVHFHVMYDQDSPDGLEDILSDNIVQCNKNLSRVGITTVFDGVSLYTNVTHNFEEYYNDPVLENEVLGYLQIDSVLNVFVIPSRSPFPEILGYVWPVLPDYIDHLNGLSELKNRQRIMINYTGLYSLGTLFHEICHAYGLDHVDDQCNYMYRALDPCWEYITDLQLDTIKYVSQFRSNVIVPLQE